MKNFTLSVLMIFFSVGLSAQTYLIDEDFSSGVGTTPPSGWSNVQLYTVFPAIDFWHFDNPGSRNYFTPFDSSFAIFDSDSISNNGILENIALESPEFNTLGVNSVTLTFDYIFGVPL